MQEGLPLPVNQRNSYITSIQISNFFVELLRTVSVHLLRKHLSESSPFRNPIFEHGPPNGSYTFLQGEVTKLWRRCFFPCVPSWKIEPLGPFWGITPKTDNVSCAMWVVKLGWEFGMFWRIWWGGGSNRVQWERFELQQETCRLSWASFFLSSQALCIFRDSLVSRFWTLTMAISEHCNMWFNGSIYQECR